MKCKFERSVHGRCGPTESSKWRRPQVYQALIATCSNLLIYSTLRRRLLILRGLHRIATIDKQ